jgi:hypothetical protein
MASHHTKTGIELTPGTSSVLNTGTSKNRCVSIKTRNHNEDRIKANFRNVEYIKDRHFNEQIC